MQTRIFRLSVLILLFVVSISSGWTQTRLIKGTVYTSEGKPAAGVRVTADHARGSYFTSFDGKYQLTIHEKTKYLHFAFADREEKLSIEGITIRQIDFGHPADEKLPAKDSSQIRNKVNQGPKSMDQPQKEEKPKAQSDKNSK